MPSALSVFYISAWTPRHVAGNTVFGQGFCTCLTSRMKKALLADSCCEFGDERSAIHRLFIFAKQSRLFSLSACSVVSLSFASVQTAAQPATHAGVSNHFRTDLWVFLGEDKRTSAGPCYHSIRV